MRHIDFAPLMRSATALSSFDQLLNEQGRASRESTNTAPYNILKKDADTYQIVIAAAGLNENDIEITITQNALDVSVKTEENTSNIEYLHRGLPATTFSQKFELADTIKVSGAAMNNGLLTIELQREIPEEQKPRRITIETGLVEKKAA